MFGQGRMSWRQREIVTGKASTFFTHGDLRNNQRASSVPAQRSKDREPYCKQWNYSGKCGCLTSDTAFKTTHKCKVCDSKNTPCSIVPKEVDQFPQLFHKLPVTKSIKNNDNPKILVIQTELYFTLILLNFLKLFPVPVTTILLHVSVNRRLNLEAWKYYLQDYSDRDVVSFLEY